MKTPKLLDFEFFRCLEESLATVMVEDLSEICPGPAIPPGAVIAGAMPEKMKIFLALLTMVDARLAFEQATFETATVSGDHGKGMPFSELRSLQENSTEIERLFWHMLRAEVPPPAEFANEARPPCGYGPKLEVYYTSEEVVGPGLSHSSQSFEVEPSPQVQ